MAREPRRPPEHRASGLPAALMATIALYALAIVILFVAALAGVLS